jgi:hypothetical protein
LYERRCCARGEAQNPIKEAQPDLFGRCASCHRYQANQLRLLLAALAYTLMINLHRLALKGTKLAQAAPCGASIATLTGPRPTKVGRRAPQSHPVLRSRNIRGWISAAHAPRFLILARSP